MRVSFFWFIVSLKPIFCLNPVNPIVREMLTTSRPSAGFKPLRKVAAVSSAGRVLTLEEGLQKVYTN